MRTISLRILQHIPMSIGILSVFYVNPSVRPPVRGKSLFTRFQEKLDFMFSTAFSLMKQFSAVFIISSTKTTTTKCFIVIYIYTKRDHFGTSFYEYFQIQKSCSSRVRVARVRACVCAYAKSCMYMRVSGGSIDSLHVRSPQVTVFITPDFNN